MKTVFVLFDSLNRKSLEPYGAQTIKTPNFRRLAERTITFDTHYAGSLPCMPARRDMQTGRLSFLHRSWGPLEPFDNSFPEIMFANGVYSHLVTDHYHYWEDGGWTYHNRYDTYEFVRGQERDPWKAMVQPPWDRLREKYHHLQFDDQRRSKHGVNVINRELMSKAEEDFTAVQCFTKGIEFLDVNRKADDWFLQIETFDPHEPFFAPASYREDYQTNYNGPILDWPPYERVNEAPDECAELRANYCAIVALCDAQLGRILDYFDAHDMWRDTALIVSTDHGFLLGEHDWWAKLRMPCYEEVAHIPLFLHHPDFPSKAGERRRALTQTIDLMSTFVDIHGISPPSEVQGRSLMPLMECDQPFRKAALYGVFGSAVNITDGHYTYFRYPDDLQNQEIFNYTLMPTNITSIFETGELSEAALVGPFGFTKGCPVLKVPTLPKYPGRGRFLEPGFLQDTDTVLYDLEADPGQMHPIRDEEVERQLTNLMLELMRDTEAPPETYVRLALDA